jgi:predicted O-linked N-acetylglucosamine transferase (SPINDLY family)
MLRFRAGDRDRALEAIRRVLTLDPAHAQAHRLAAYILHDARDLERALYHARRAVAGNPAGSQAHTMLGMVLRSLGQTDESLAMMRRAVELNPRDPEAWTTLGAACDALERFNEAAEAHRRALAINPDHPVAADNLALTLLASARPDEAADLARRSALARPNDALAARRLAFCLNYDHRSTRADINAAHRRWGALIEHTTPTPAPHPPRTPGERLRIGLLSPDFRRHSVAHFVRPLFEHLDRDRFEVHAFFCSDSGDDITDALRPLPDRWHEAARLNDAQLDALIRDARIDLLIDLAGHFAGNRLAVLARRPAPIQATWLGYPATTGLSRIDARFVDSLTDPPECDARPEPERGSERFIRLDPCFICFTPPVIAPTPAEAPPARAGAPFTFASFNDAKKLDPGARDLWARVMTRVPASRLLLKGGAFASPAVRDHLVECFRRRAVEPDRLLFEPHTPDPADHLAAYRRVDLALDTYPYHGTTTTCEALWMGVPVLSRVGETHAARVGLSLLSAVGLPELAPDSDDAFVDLAVSIASDPERLAALRAGLRERVAASPLTDAPAFARRFGRALIELARESAP